LPVKGAALGAPHPAQPPPAAARPLPARPPALGRSNRLPPRSRLLPAACSRRSKPCGSQARYLACGGGRDNVGGAVEIETMTSRLWFHRRVGSGPLGVSLLRQPESDLSELSLQEKGRGISTTWHSRKGSPALHRRYGCPIGSLARH